MAMDPKSMNVSLDKRLLKDAVAKISEGAGPQEWCFACGAGAASVKLDTPIEAVQQATQVLSNPELFREVVASLKDVAGQAEWCFACGAGAKSSPMTRVINPADISDAMIDELANELIGAVRISK